MQTRSRHGMAGIELVCYTSVIVVSLFSVK